MKRREQKFRRIIGLVLPVLLSCALGLQSLGQQTASLSQSDEATRSRERVEEMTAVIEQVTISVLKDGKMIAAERSPKALLRNIDVEAGRKNEDGSLWLWSYEGLPVAMVELWTQVGRHNWGTTLLAVSSKDLHGEIGSRQWRPRNGNGVKFEVVPQGGKPHKLASIRKAQMRKIARRFSTNIDDPGQSDKQQFRLLTEPIHRYQGTEIEDGAIFAYVRGQSNPEVLLFLQSRDGKWEYGFLRCSSNELVAQLDNKEIWVARRVPGWIGEPSSAFWVVHQRYTPTNPQ